MSPRSDMWVPSRPRLDGRVPRISRSEDEGVMKAPHPSLIVAGLFWVLLFKILYVFFCEHENFR